MEGNVVVVTLLLQVIRVQFNQFVFVLNVVYCVHPCLPAVDRSVIHLCLSGLFGQG